MGFKLSALIYAQLRDRFGHCVAWKAIVGMGCAPVVKEENLGQY